MQVAVLHTARSDPYPYPHPNPNPNPNPNQELAAAVLSYLSALDECVKAITAANGIRPLVAMLTAGTPVAQSHAAASLSALASGNPRNCKQIISEGAIPPLVSRAPSHCRTPSYASTNLPTPAPPAITPP